MENQLTLPGFEVALKKREHLTINDKANFIYRNFKEKMPNLYEQIMKGKTK
jgi:hypothetical protein